MFGVPIHGPADVFCDNNSVVQSSTTPASVINKKHNAVSFHNVREKIRQEQCGSSPMNRRSQTWPIC